MGIKSLFKRNSLIKGGWYCPDKDIHQQRQPWPAPTRPGMARVNLGVNYACCMPFWFVLAVPHPAGNIIYLHYVTVNSMYRHNLIQLVTLSRKQTIGVESKQGASESRNAHCFRKTFCYLLKPLVMWSWKFQFWTWTLWTSKIKQCGQENIIWKQKICFYTTIWNALLDQITDLSSPTARCLFFMIKAGDPCLPSLLHVGLGSLEEREDPSTLIKAK